MTTKYTNTSRGLQNSLYPYRYFWYENIPSGKPGAIFAHSLQKMTFFLKNQYYDQNFAQFSFVLSQKRQFFAFFRRKYFQNQNIGP
jgi:hypothetical protein